MVTRMRKKIRKAWLAAGLILLALFCLGGCKPSRKKVESSSYYKELQKKYKKLQKEKEKLQKASESQESISDAEQRAEKYLAKIARDRLVKMEIGYADDMEESIYIDESGIFGLATKLGERADRTAKYTPDQLKAGHDPLYEYILYDEDNAVYEITVYGSDYVLFSDLPNYVYYVPGASVLGDAFLRYRTDYPASSLLHRLADSPMMTDSKGRYYENHVVVKTANYIDKMKKTRSDREKAAAYWKKKVGFREDETVDPIDYEPESWKYTYYHHGNKMVLTLYDIYFSILNVDGNRTWYQADKKDIQGIKDILRADREARSAEKESSGGESSSGEEGSHSREIEEESVIGPGEGEDQE